MQQGQVNKPQELTRILESVLKLETDESGKSRIKVRISIPYANSFIRTYTLPWASKRERVRLLTYLADEEIPIPASERLIDFLLTEKAGSFRQFNVILSGIRKAVLYELAACFKEAGFSIELIGFALLAHAKVLDFKAAEHTLFIKEQQGLVQLILYQGQIPKIIRIVPSVARYLGIEAESHLEVQHIFAYFSTLQEQIEIQRVVIGTGKEAEKLGRRICDFLGLAGAEKLESHSLAGVLSTLPKLAVNEEIEPYLAVTGMALEELKTSPNNFWRDELQWKNDRRHKWLAGAGVLFLILIGLIWCFSLTEKVLTLRQEVGQLQAVSQKLEQAEGSRRGQIQAWEELLAKPTKVGRELTQLSSLLSEGLTFEQIEMKEGTLALQGRAAEAASVQGLFKKLESLGWQNARLTNYQLQEKAVRSTREIEFTVQAERSGK
jgi:type IV pilus assembly protein PilM